MTRCIPTFYQLYFYLRGRETFPFLFLPPCILFSSGSSFYLLLSVPRLVPLFRIQDAVSKSNYYGGTLGVETGRTGQRGREYMSIRGRIAPPPLLLKTPDQRKDQCTLKYSVVYVEYLLFILL